MTSWGTAYDLRGLSMEDVAISHPVPDLASLGPLSLDEGVQQCFVHEERVTQELLRFNGINFDLVEKSN